MRETLRVVSGLSVVPVIGLESRDQKIGLAADIAARQSVVRSGVKQRADVAARIALPQARR
jgi:hypothetical protein